MIPHRLVSALAALVLSLLLAPAAQAFCGFYVAKADADLFNNASKVVMVRDGDRTVITMANDYEGEPSEFAMVIPTPVVLKREQVNVGEAKLIDHLDAYTAPRVVEYFDEDPCRPRVMAEMARSLSAAPTAGALRGQRARALGVTIEEEYSVGEYDILILSAKESGGLQTWLEQNGYRVPPKATRVLGSYLAQGMKFFVAKVNLEAQSKLGTRFLRPIQIAFETEKFMLPIRLGTVNAKGKQDLILFTLTRGGRVEPVNYRNERIPSNLDVPLYVQKRFGDFYQAMFATAVERSGGRSVFTEYAWDMSWCDPCAADPLTAAQLRQLGVFWVSEAGGGAQPRPLPGRLPGNAPGSVPGSAPGIVPGGVPGIVPGPQPVDVFVTRLHMRYDAVTFPEDLRLQITGDRKNFQGRYVTRHPFKGAATCDAAEDYRQGLARRFEDEAQRLANLTGWSIEEIRSTMRETGQSLPKGAGGDAGKPWWSDLWKPE